MAIGVATIGALAVGTLDGGGSDAKTQGQALTAAARPTPPPVVLLTLDELPVDSLLGTDGRIDAVRYPNLAALARISTWYPNATTVYDSTSKAVPAILDSKLPRPRRPATFKGHPKNVFTLFGGRGYRIVASEEATAMCPRRYCRNARTKLPPITKLQAGGRKQRFAKWVGSIRGDSPTFYYKHVFLPHGPRIYLPSGKEFAPTPPGLEGLTTPRGFHDRGLTDHNKARYLLQLAFTDREVGRLLAKLRRVGLLDKALLVITADHGFAFEVGVPDRRKVTRSNIDEIVTVPLFVKAPRQRIGRVDDTYVRTVDILPTIAETLGFRLNWRHDGRPASAPSTRARRGVSIVTRDFKRTIRISARALERRRRQNVRRAARLFGSGARSAQLYRSPFASLYRIGPHRELLGKPLARLRTRGPGGVRAHVQDARLRRAFNPASSLLPTRIAGTISGAGSGARRDIAVAVNGRVLGLGRSLHLLGGSPELFAILIPDDSLRRGRNDVRLYEVSRQGRRLILTLLGRA